MAVTQRPSARLTHAVLLVIAVGNRDQGIALLSILQMKKPRLREAGENSHRSQQEGRNQGLNPSSWFQ